MTRTFGIESVFTLMLQRQPFESCKLLDPLNFFTYKKYNQKLHHVKYYDGK